MVETTHHVSRYMGRVTDLSGRDGDVLIDLWDIRERQPAKYCPSGESLVLKQSMARLETEYHFVERPL